MPSIKFHRRGSQHLAFCKQHLSGFFVSKYPRLRSSEIWILLSPLVEVVLAELEKLLIVICLIRNYNTQDANTMSAKLCVPMEVEDQV